MLTALLSASLAGMDVVGSEGVEASVGVASGDEKEMDSMGTRGALEGIEEGTLGAMETEGSRVGATELGSGTRAERADVAAAAIADFGLTTARDFGALASKMLSGRPENLSVQEYTPAALLLRNMISDSPEASSSPNAMII